jgi:hypothetical protein
MKRILLQTILGIFCSFSGLFLGYIFLSGLDKGGNPLLIIPSVFLTGIGVYFLLRAGKSDDTVIAKLDEKDLQMPITAAAGSLQKKNEMVNHWNKTMENRDRLKLLEVSASASE